MKNYIKLIICILLINTGSLSFAESELDEYYSYEDEGRLIIKIRGFGAMTNGKPKSMPAPTSARGIANPKPNDKLTTKGYGVEGATGLFFNDHLASELSVGFGVYKSKAPVGIAHNYSKDAKPSKKKDLYILPMSLLVQYHVAPFGAISPYVGGGLHYSFLFTRSRDYKINNSKGPVLQAGVDLVAKDDTVVNIDVKKYIMQTKAQYKNIVDKSLSSKVKIDPLVVSVGIGWKF